MIPKIITLALTLFALVAGRDAFAQKVDVTGVYSATFDCRDIHARYTVQIIQNDDRMSVLLSEYPVGAAPDAPSGVLEMRGAFMMFGLDVLLRPVEWKKGPSRINRWMSDFDIKVAPVKNQLVGRFGYQCGQFELKRDSRLSKELTNRIKNERKGLERAASKDPGSIDLRKLTGLWEGIRLERAQVGDYRLFVIDNKAWLIVAGSGYQSFPLAPEKIEGGGVVFRLNPAEAQGLDFTKVHVTLTPADTFSTEHVKLLLLTQEGRPSRPVELRRPILPGIAQITASGRQAYFYEDWQWRTYSSSYRVKEEETREHLRQTMDKLKEDGGWRCLSQITRKVSPRANVRITSTESGANRLYLIFSPQGNKGLLYRAAPSENGVIEGAKYDYPLVHSVRRTFFYSDTVITLISQPSPAEALASVPDIDVTVFVLGRAPGDYGSGCRY